MNTLIEQADQTKQPGALFRYSMVLEMPFAPDYEKVHAAIGMAMIESLREFPVAIVVVNGYDCISVEDVGRVN